MRNFLIYADDLVLLGYSNMRIYNFLEIWLDECDIKWRPITNFDGENFSENSHFQDPEGDGTFLMRGNVRRKKKITQWRASKFVLFKNIIRDIKSRKMRCVGYVAHMGEIVQNFIQKT
jgi:hypothetical protein